MHSDETEVTLFVNELSLSLRRTHSTPLKPDSQCFAIQRRQRPHIVPCHGGVFHLSPPPDEISFCRQIRTVCLLTLRGYLNNPCIYRHRWFVISDCISSPFAYTSCNCSFFLLSPPSEPAAAPRQPYTQYSVHYYRRYRNTLVSGKSAASVFNAILFAPYFQV